MPGLLAMEKQDNAIDSLEVKKSIHDSVVASDHASASTPNGLTNGVTDSQNTFTFSDTSQNIPTTNGVAGKEHGELPLLDRSWRGSDSNKPFGKLLTRMSQMCYTDMTELVGKLNEIPIEQSQVNGVNPATEDTDAGSLKKKRLLMDFASTWRERFVKARVISDWARTSGDDVAKVIDLRATLATRDHAIQNAVQAVAEIKRDTVGARQPAPNLTGAMQYLSSGESQYTDLGYLKQPPLSARQILELLNRMAVVANERIWLHETQLPYYMSDYAISNGRVTFQTPGEFELDLACLDEDPEKSPWYFVDFRFSFSPSPAAIDIQVRSHLESQINAAAVTKGLQACYDFCHDFVLDMKLIEAESQARDLLNKQWFDAIRIQRMRRNVIMQYWTSVQGKPSWLEFGVSSGKQASSTHPSTATLSTKWHVDGERRDEGLAADWTHINVESILNQAISRHSMLRLRRLEEYFSSRAKQSSVLVVQLQDREDNCLTLDLRQAHPDCTQQIKISIDQYTGKWVLQPAIRPLIQLAQALNTNPNINIAAVLEQRLCSIMQAGCYFEADLHSWKEITEVQPRAQKNFKTIFEDAVEISLWRPSTSWNDDWGLALSTSLQSHRWWTIRFDNKPAGRIIAAAKELKINQKTWRERMSLADFEGVAQVQYIVLSSEIHNSKMTRHITEPKFLRSLTNYSVPRAVWFLNLRDLLRTNKSRSHIGKWACDLVRITQADRHYLPPHNFRYFMTITIRPGHLKHLRHSLSKKRATGISINGTGGLAMELDLPFGDPFTEHVRAVLTKISQLDEISTVVETLHLKCTQLDLRSASLTYDTTHDLTARISFAKDASTKHQLKLEPSFTNPHQRIRQQLEQLLNQENERAFGHFAHVLLLTLPLLMVAEKLETKYEQSISCNLRVRNISWYSLSYNTTPPIAFTIRARVRTLGGKKMMKWHVEHERIMRPGQTSHPEELVKALKAFWTDPGHEFTGLGMALVADAKTIESALEKLDMIVRTHGQKSSLPEAHAKEQNKNAVKPEAAKNEVEEKKPDVIMLD